MGLDSYSRKSVDLIDESVNEVDKIEHMKLDSDLKSKLRKVKNILEMESVLSKKQNEQEQFISELKNSSRRSLDAVSFSDVNLNGSVVSQPTNQEEVTSEFGHKYSEEEKQQAKESLQQSLKKGEDLIAMLEASINEYYNSDCVDVEYTPGRK